MIDPPLLSKLTVTPATPGSKSPWCPSALRSSHTSHGSTRHGRRRSSSGGAEEPSSLFVKVQVTVSPAWRLILIWSRFIVTYGRRQAPTLGHDLRYDIGARDKRSNSKLSPSDNSKPSSSQEAVKENSSSDS